MAVTKREGFTDLKAVLRDSRGRWTTFAPPKAPFPFAFIEYTKFSFFSYLVTSSLSPNCPVKVWFTPAYIYFIQYQNYQNPSGSFKHPRLNQLFSRKTLKNSYLEHPVLGQDDSRDWNPGSLTWMSFQNLSSKGLEHIRWRRTNQKKLTSFLLA